jgi:hypothetical protein
MRQLPIWDPESAVRESYWYAAIANRSVPVCFARNVRDRLFKSHFRATCARPSEPNKTLQTFRHAMGSLIDRGYAFGAGRRERAMVSSRPSAGSLWFCG